MRQAKRKKGAREKEQGSKAEQEKRRRVSEREMERGAEVATTSSACKRRIWYAVGACQRPLTERLTDLPRGRRNENGVEESGMESGAGDELKLKLKQA